MALTRDTYGLRSYP